MEIAELDIRNEILNKIFQKETKINSKETYLFIPKELILLIEDKENEYTGRGVTREESGKYSVKISENGEYRNKGCFETFEEACCVYKYLKYEIVKKKLEKFKLEGYDEKLLEKLLPLKSFVLEIEVRSPTINGAYQISKFSKNGRHMFLSQKVRDFKKELNEVAEKLYDLKKMENFVKLTMHNYYRLNKGRDCGNPNKFIQDALEGVVYENDFIVFQGTDRKVEGCTKNKLVILVEEILEEETLSKI